MWSHGRVVTAVRWSEYRGSIGDRSELFARLAEGWPVRRALYPGSYVDLSPSTAIESVTYLDTDRRAARFFADPELVEADLAGRRAPGAGATVTFLEMDYTQPLPVPTGEFDLLISLFAGPVWDNCRSYLRPGGLLLANTSHGDASLAALDPALRLVAVVSTRDGRYRMGTTNLDGFLIPKRPAAADPDEIRRSGRGIAYTRSAFAYLFQLT